MKLIVDINGYAVRLDAIQAVGPIEPAALDGEPHVFEVILQSGAVIEVMGTETQLRDKREDVVKLWVRELKNS